MTKYNKTPGTPGNPGDVNADKEQYVKIVEVKR